MRKKQTFISIGIIGGLLIASIFLGGWKIVKTKQEATNNVGILLQITQGVYSSTSKVTMKYGVMYKNYDSSNALLQLGRDLSRELRMPESNHISQVEGHPSYQVSNDLADGRSESCILTGMGKQAGSYFLLRLESTQSIPKQELIDWQQQWTQKLNKLGLQASWNVMVQGELPIHSNNSITYPLQTMAGVVQKLHAKQKESYQGIHTVSITYQSPILKDSLSSGSHKINLQMAAHRNTVTSQWNFTIGVPLITEAY